MPSNKSFDVIVLGGGFIGLNTAYELAQKKINVAVLDRHSFLYGASGASAAMIEAQLDSYRGEPFLSLAKKSAALFPTLQNELEALTRINFELETCGILQLAFSQDDIEKLQESITQQKNLNFHAEWIDPLTLQNNLPTVTPLHKGGAFYADDGQVNGDKFGTALLEACRQENVFLKENVGALELTMDEGRVTGVRSKNETFKAAHVVVAAGAWSQELCLKIGVSLALVPKRGQLLYFDTPTRFLPYPIYTTRFGYVTPKQGFTLIGSTMEDAGFNQTTTEEGKKHLLDLTNYLVPSLLNFPLQKMVAGLRPATPDGLPYLGPLTDHPNVIVACGHFRNGLLLCPITAALIAEHLTQKKANFDLTPFSPERFEQYQPKNR